ncbi:spaetzle domain-containing protein [Colletes latitarsis]|uniref:spaetzle domain-containing protein n=1 Tax=Colletes latitarsis TaxID=2605962 RepID=UPI0040370851
MPKKNTKGLLEGGMLLLLVFEVYGHPQQSNTILQSLKPSERLRRDLDRVPSCKNKTFCEVIPYYPTELVRNALQKNPHLRFYINRDELDASSRQEDEIEEESLCVSTEQIVFPKSGITKSHEWKYIVNHENLTQSVRIETCLEVDKPCKMIEGFAEGYVTRCRQKYIYRQLVAVSADGSINRESFRFPVSCCCHIEFQGDKFLKAYHSNY